MKTENNTSPCCTPRQDCCSEEMIQQCEAEGTCQEGCCDAPCCSSDSCCS